MLSGSQNVGDLLRVGHALFDALSHNQFDILLLIPTAGRLKRSRFIGGSAARARSFWRRNQIIRH